MVEDARNERQRRREMVKARDRDEDETHHVGLKLSTLNSQTSICLSKIQDREWKMEKRDLSFALSFSTRFRLVFGSF